MSMPKKDSEATLRPNRQGNRHSSSVETFSSEVDVKSPMIYVERGYRDNPGFPRRRLSFPCSKFAMDKAAQGGHMGVLQLLHYQVD